MAKEINCYLQVNSGKSCQEHYCTMSRQARCRAKALRDLGYKVITSTPESQITSVGRIKLTTLTIMPGVNQDTFDLPEVNLVRL